MDGCFIIARFRAHEGHAGEVAELLRGFPEPSRAEEGCLFYDLYRDQEDRNLFVIVDGWRDRAAFDAHAGSAHVARTLAALAPHLEGDPIIAKLDRVA
jgi:quinol monooxygenase YgiN